MLQHRDRAHPSISSISSRYPPLSISPGSSYHPQQAPPAPIARHLPSRLLGLMQLPTNISPSLSVSIGLCRLTTIPPRRYSSGTDVLIETRGRECVMPMPLPRSVPLSLSSTSSHQPRSHAIWPGCIASPPFAPSCLPSAPARVGNPEDEAEHGKRSGERREYKDWLVTPQVGQPASQEWRADGERRKGH